MDHIKINFWRFYKPLPDVFKIGPQNNNLESGFQNGYPLLHRIESNPKIASNIGKIEKLAASGGNRPEEILK